MCFTYGFFTNFLIYVFIIFVYAQRKKGIVS